MSWSRHSSRPPPPHACGDCTSAAASRCAMPLTGPRLPGPRAPGVSGWASAKPAATELISLEAVEAHHEELARGAAAAIDGDVADRADIGEVSRQVAQLAPRAHEQEILADVSLGVGGHVELIVDAAAPIPFHGVEGGG